jgi:hypothetical protein
VRHSATKASFIREPRQQIAMARQIGSTPANQVAAAQLVHVVDERPEDA